MLNTGPISKRFTGLFLIRRAGSMWFMRVGRGKGRRDWRRIGFGEKFLKYNDFEYFIGFLILLKKFYLKLKSLNSQFQNQGRSSNEKPIKSSSREITPKSFASSQYISTAS